MSSLPTTCGFGQAFDPAALRVFFPAGQTAGPERLLQGSHRQAVAAAGDDGNTQLPGDERGLGPEPVGLGEMPQGIRSPALAEKEGTEIKERIEGPHACAAAFLRPFALAVRRRFETLPGAASVRLSRTWHRASQNCASGQFGSIARIRSAMASAADGLDCVANRRRKSASIASTTRRRPSLSLIASKLGRRLQTLQALLEAVVEQGILAGKAVAFAFEVSDAAFPGGGHPAEFLDLLGDGQALAPGFLSEAALAAAQGTPPPRSTPDPPVHQEQCDGKRRPAAHTRAAPSRSRAESTGDRSGSG